MDTQQDLRQTPFLLNSPPASLAAMSTAAVTFEAGTPTGLLDPAVNINDFNLLPPPPSMHNFGGEGPPIYASDNYLRRTSVPSLRDPSPYGMPTNDAWTTPQSVMLGSAPMQDPRLLARRSMPAVGATAADVLTSRMSGGGTPWMPGMGAAAPSLMTSTSWGNGDGMVMSGGGGMMSMDDGQKLSEQDRKPSISQPTGSVSSSKRRAQQRIHSAEYRARKRQETQQMKTEISTLHGRVAELETKLASQTAEQLQLQRMLLKAQEVIVRLSRSSGPSTMTGDSDPGLREMLAQVLPGGLENAVSPTETVQNDNPNHDAAPNEQDFGEQELQALQEQVA